MPGPQETGVRPVGRRTRSRFHVLPPPQILNGFSGAAHSETGSAGRTPEQLLDTPALALGRTARAAVAGSHHDSLLARRRGRAVVDIAPGGNRCAGALGDHPLDHHDVFASFVMQPHLITGPYGVRGLDPYPVDPDVPGPAGTGRGRTGPGQPHRPDPAVHPPSLITCHSANLSCDTSSLAASSLVSSATGPAASGMSVNQSTSVSGSPTVARTGRPGGKGQRPVVPARVQEASGSRPGLAASPRSPRDR